MGQGFPIRACVLALTAISCSISFANPPVADPSVASATSHAQSESVNFSVRHLGSRLTAKSIANECELIRTRLQLRLLGEESATAWQPKCVVVLHATRPSYLQAVGPGGGQTVGSSLVRSDAGNVVERRIDLLVEDRDKGLAALPHEMVHVLLGEVFPDAPVPHWAEEGLATLEDSADKRRRHLRDLHHAYLTDSMFPLPSLFAENTYPTGRQRAVFYGQSMSVVDFLRQQGEPHGFLRFVQESKRNGYDRALATVYGIQNVRELEARWRRHVTSQLTAMELSAN